MDRDLAFKSYIEGGLELFGIEADEEERAVMAGVWNLWAPALDALLAADPGEVEAEPAADLARAPEG